MSASAASTPSVGATLLNPAQQQAVDHGAGPCLVQAGAGSGKTRVLTGRIVRLVEAEGVDPRQILAITFTTKAAGEMRRRLRERLGEAAASLTVATFHSLGVQMLARHGMALGSAARLQVQDESDALQRVRTVMRGLKHPLGARGERPSDVLERIGKAKAWLATHLTRAARATPATRGALLTAYRQGSDARWWEDPTGRAIVQAPDWERWQAQFAGYQQQLAAEQLVDYEDLLVLPVLLCATQAAVREAWTGQWRWILVDEYQDTDSVQELLLEELCVTHRNLMVVGDPAQAIYAWRGARVENIREFPTRWQARVIELSDNYRSTPEVIAAANATLTARRAEVGSRLELQTTNASGDPVRVWHCQSQEVEAAVLARELKRHKRAKRIRHWRDVFVLYRVNRAVRALELGLKRAGVPYRIANAHALHEGLEARPLLALLRLVANPWDTQAWQTLLTALCGAGVVSAGVAEEIRSRARVRVTPVLTLLQTYPETGEGLKPAVVEAVASVADFVEAARARIAEVGIPATLQAATGDLELRSRLVTALAAAESEDDDEAAQAIEDRIRLFDELLTYLEEACLRDPTLTHDPQLLLEDLLVRAPGDGWREWLEGSGDAVTLMSIHAAKGLEAPWVWVVGLEEGVFPIRSRGPEAAAQLGEEARLFYVAVTRAEQHLVCSSSRTRELTAGEVQPRLPSRFLSDWPETLYRLEHWGGDVMTQASAGSPIVSAP